MIAIDFPGIHLRQKQPERILTATSLEQVQPLIQEVEALWKQGYYAAGFVSYEASPAFDPYLAVKTKPALPLVWFAVYKATEKISDKDWLETGDYHVSDWTADSSKMVYQQSIQATHEAIARGDTYQVNYSIRLHAAFEGDAWAYYQHLTSLQTGYHAFLDIGDFQILSISPELFFRWEQNTITTRPMKGTAKRGRSFEEDQFQAQALKHSTKGRAENLMIVDLLRNDLGKIAIPGTADVPQLFTLERYPTLWTMTSTVEAKTRPQTTLADVFTALFPCGSITGAPKRKTMELIRTLEQSPREAYCGTVGYLKPGGEAVFNVAIRTVIVNKQKQRATYGVGGGITWDSTSLGEYEEVITKAKVLQSQPYNHQLLESIRLEDGQYTLLDKHLERLKKSADYFGYHCPFDAVEKKLEQLAKQYAKGVYKVRLLLALTGEITLEANPLKELMQPQSVTLAKSPVNSDNSYLYHKTTERSIYEQHKIDGFFDTLLWNERDELTEFTIGNVVLEIDGELVTPSQEAGLLAGTMRAELLASGKIIERVISKEEVFQASAIWLVNSVRGWVKVELQ